MGRRYVAVWFPHLVTDRLARLRPELGKKPLVLSAASHGRMIITASNLLAEANGIYPGMVVADARAIVPDLEVLIDKPGFSTVLLNRIAEWCIRFTPVVSVDLPDGLLMDVTGCPHLWDGENEYIQTIDTRLSAFGYEVRLAIAGTVGCAWAIARFGKQTLVENEKVPEALVTLPPAALRITHETVGLLQQLGLRQIGQILGLPRSALRRRFGQFLLDRLDQALGRQEEKVEPLQPVEPWQERLNCLEPILTRGGIEIALTRLLEILCGKLKHYQQGLRVARFKGFRVDGKTVQIEIGTNRASHNELHFFKLFELKLSTLEPESGIEVFVLEAPVVEDNLPVQDKIWETGGSHTEIQLSELLDRFAGKFGKEHISRFLPDEHYWPERSVKPAISLRKNQLQMESGPEQAITIIISIRNQLKLLHLFLIIHRCCFSYKGKLHKIIKADGPERIEQEWWLAARTTPGLLLCGR